MPTARIELIDITFWDVPTRRLQRQQTRIAHLSYPDPEPATLVDPELDWVFGHWDHTKYAVDLEGHVVEITDPPQAWLGPVPTGKQLF